MLAQRGVQVDAPGQGRAELEGPHDGVARRLVLGDHPGLLPGGPPPGRARHVQVLAHVQLGPQLVPHRSDLRGNRAEGAVGQHHGHVAHQHRGRLAEAPVLAPPAPAPVAVHKPMPHGGLAPPGGRPVHHVVVDQGEGVQQLQGAARSRRPVAVGIAAPQNPPPVAVGGPDALAPGQHQVGQVAQRLAQHGIEFGPAPGLGRQQVGQFGGDPGRDRSELPGCLGHWPPAE